MVDAGFDLNHLPEAETPSEPQKPVAQPSKSNNKQPQKKTITPEFYAKVEKLFKVLAICDSRNFDIRNIEIPEDFSMQNKAMMTLEKLGKSNLIKIKDTGRYRRIMSNCKQIVKAITAKTADSMSLDDHFSGGTYEERLARLSALENFKEPNPISTRTGSQLRIYSRGPVARLQQSPQGSTSGPPTFFRFL